MHAQLYCPRCRVPLIVGAAHGRRVHGCTHCAGVWMDLELGARLSQALDHELGGLVGSLAAHAQGRADTAPAIGCPQCHAPLQRYLASSQRIELDHCPHHGTWFDRDEAARLAHALAIDRAYNAYNRGPAAHGLSAGAQVALAAGGAAAVGAAAYTAHAVVQERQQHHGIDVEVVADVAETGVELATEGAFDAGLDFAGDATDVGVEAAGALAEAGGEAVGGIFEMLGGIFDAFS